MSLREPLSPFAPQRLIVGLAVALAGCPALAAEDPIRDDQLRRTTHGHHAIQAVPSAQAAQGPPTVALMPQAPQLVSLQAAPTPVVQVPAPQPIVVQTQAPSIVVQQTPPTVYLAQPSQPANIQVLAPAPQAPTVGATSTPQLFLQPVGPSAQASPSVASAPQVAFAASTPAVMVAAPQVAAAPAVAQLEAIPPGPIGRAIGSFGEMLAKHKMPRIRATTTTVLTQAQTQVALVPAQPSMATTPVVAAPSGESTVAQPSPQGGHWLRHPFKAHGR